MFKPEERKKMYRESFGSVLRRISSRYESEGIKDSGGFGEGLELRLTLDGARDSIEVYGVGYSEFVERGRGPGKAPPAHKLRQWVKRKLGESDEKQIRRKSFLIGRKISLEGDKAHRNKSRLGLISGEYEGFIQKDMPLLMNRLSQRQLSEVKDDFIRTLKENIKNITNK